MTAPNPADVLARALRNHKTDVIFGVPGGGPNLEVVGATGRQGIRFVLAHTETAACIMASVYGHLSGRLSAAVVTRGPGAASAVNGAAQATLDRHPLVLVTDTVPAASAIRVPHQRLDQRTMLSPTTKASYTFGFNIDEAKLTRMLGQAMDGPAGAVHLDYDASSFEAEPEPTTHEAPAAVSAQPKAATTVAALVASATRPVVILGLGAVAADQDLTPLLESFAAPVFTTYQAIGTIPSEHRLAAGLFTNGASERELIDKADLVIGIGLDPVEPIPAQWGYGAPYISVVEHPTTDPYFPIEAEIVGPLEHVVPMVLRGNHQTWTDNAGANHRQSIRAKLAGFNQPSTNDPNALSPIGLVKTVAASAPTPLTITVDAGAHFLAVMPFWPIDEPKRLLISNGLATMGYALPAAVAAALARPGEPVLCFVGDGGLGMTLAELETIGRLGLPVTVVVFNDSALSLIRIKQQDGHGGSDAVTYRPTDFAGMAPSFGLKGTTVDSEASLASALDNGWDQPRLIDARIDPSEYDHLISITRG